MELTLTDLFRQKPGQWGLRGDPYLWDEMAERFADLPLPATEQELRALLEEGYVQLTGQEIGSDTNAKVERYGSRGMSGGVVSSAFWQNVAIPLLLRRYAEHAA